MLTLHNSTHITNICNPHRRKNNETATKSCVKFITYHILRTYPAQIHNTPYVKHIPYLTNNLFQPVVYARMEHTSPVLQTPHNMIVVLIDGVPVELVSVR